MAHTLAGSNLAKKFRFSSRPLPLFPTHVTFSAIYFNSTRIPVRQQNAVLYPPSPLYHWRYRKVQHVLKISKSDICFTTSDFGQVV